MTEYYQRLYESSCVYGKRTFSIGQTVRVLPGNGIPGRSEIVSKILRFYTGNHSKGRVYCVLTLECGREHHFPLGSIRHARTTR